jgi:hypothetical protein
MSSGTDFHRLDLRAFAIPRADLAPPVPACKSLHGFAMLARRTVRWGDRRDSGISRSARGFMM